MNELAMMIDDFLYHNRYNKSDIAKSLGLTRQGLYNLLRKKNFSVEDANRILAPLGYKISYQIDKVQNE